MKNAVSVTVPVGDRQLTFSSGHLARQADGAVTVRLGDTVLFSAACASKKPREGIDYFPLQVEYREKFYAVGRFPGGFFKREARPAEKEILTARLTDRPLRPLFPAWFRNEVQIINMLLSADGLNDADALSVVAASASLSLSDIPFAGPIAGVRVGRIDGRLILNPTHEERDQSDLDLIYAGTADKPLMIEGWATEIPEADLLAAMRFAQQACIPLIEAQPELRRKLGLPDKQTTEPAPDQAGLEAVRRLAGADLETALQIPGKAERAERVETVRETAAAAFLAESDDNTAETFLAAFEELTAEIMRRRILQLGRRPDGRGFDDIRPLHAEVGVLPRPHGSALFSRGETQALATVTLGSGSDSQSLDAIGGGAAEKTFMLHYNFPHYSVGETGRIAGPGRREVGHGALAEKSLAPLMPRNYPYTVRLVSDIMESNGSSSMATVCAGSLALMDAGIPVSAAAAGISIGLLSGPDKNVLLTDIIGEEDHYGDMDFKVAGTRKGITGFQTDLKIRGLDWDLVEAAFEKARTARLQVLDIMREVIAEPRPDLSPFAPRIEVVRIPVDKIGDLIGPGGKNIRRITTLTGAEIDVEDDGTVKIFCADKASMTTAVEEVQRATAEPVEGEIYNGTVTGIKEFGAFVEILPGRDGLVHISELADFHVKSVEDVCRLGDRMCVKCIGIDERGRVRLSRRAAMKDKDAAARGD